MNAGGVGFVLTITGSDFVADSIVRWNGYDRTTSFISDTELQATINAADIATAGSAQVSVFNPTPGGGGSNAQTFNIQVPGGGNNPIPTLNSLTPNSATVGDPSTVVDVIGIDFSNNSIVRWNGTDQTTTYVSSNLLRITVDASVLATADVASLTVLTPGPGGGTSVPQNFFILGSGATFFSDNFTRTDSVSIGNDWVEKNPDAFALVNGEIHGIPTPFVYYYDNLVYRPDSEARADSEVSVEFVRQDASYGSRFPQLHARVQGDSVAEPTALESYLFFVDDFESEYLPLPGRAIIAIQPYSPADYECYLAAIPFPSALAVGTRYRLRFQVSGANPVFLAGYVEQFTPTGWQLFASGSIVHDDNTVDPGIYCGPGFMPPPLVDSGTVAISKWVDYSDDMDNFYWIDLDGGTPTLPSIASLSPNTATEGDAAFTLTLTGNAFAADSVVRWNGANRTTTYISTSQLTAQILAADIATPGMAQVSVFNPGATGGTGNSCRLYHCKHAKR